MNIKLSTIVIAGIFVAGCAPVEYRHPPSVVVEQDGPPDEEIDYHSLVDATPIHEEKSKYGNPPHYTALDVTYYTLEKADNYSERGVASWYGKKFAGRKTSSGELYDPMLMTAAHARLPLPSYVEVKNLDNGKTAVVKVNDRGPFSRHRLIDLSYAAAVKLGVETTGTARVEIKVVKPEPNETPIATTTETAPTTPTIVETSTQPTFLQLGAFSSKENADRLIELVQSREITNTYLISTNQNGTTLHKVRVGPFADASSAQATATRLANDGIESKMITE